MSQAQLNVESQPKPGHGADTGELYGLLVEFDNVGDLTAAARRVRDAGYRRWDVHSPFPVHGMDEAMGVRHTKLPWAVFAFGLMGAATGILLQWWTNSTRPQAWSFVPTFLQGFDFHISGKPLFSVPANIPVMFELTVLFAALTAVIGMLAANGLPRWHHPLLGRSRFQRATSDRFFICIEARDPLFNEAATTALLASLGGAAVERVQRLARTPKPAWIPVVGLLVLSFATLPPLLAYKANVSTSRKPRIHIIQDMGNQEKFRAQQANAAFDDGRAMRYPPSDTLAREDKWALGNDPAYYEGRVGGDWVTKFPPPVEVGEPLLRRGQRQFNIYCAPCHGLDGSGNGMVAQRAREKPQISTGWVPPLSLQDETVRARPIGHLFNTITNGIRTMPPYGDQISPADRWAIIAYVRALERSQHARLEDVPADLRSELR